MTWKALFFKKFLVTGFYSGYVPVLKGTCGTLVGVSLYILLAPFHYILLSLTLLITVYGVVLSQWAENYFQEKDSQKIVIDEIAGYLITMANIKPAFPVYSLNFFILVTTGFLLFRLFDGLKPFYIRRIQKMPGGWGVMLDDILAGLYSNLALNMGIYIWIRLADK